MAWAKRLETSNVNQRIFSHHIFQKNLLLGGIYFIKMHYDVLTSVERHVVMEGVAVYLQIDGPH